MKIINVLIVLFLTASFNACTLSSENETVKGEIISPTDSTKMTKSNRENILNSLQTGNAANLVLYCAEEISLTIPPQDDNDFTKSEAQKRLSSFFKINKPNSFKVIHEGSNTTGTKGYITGNLLTENGKRFRVHLVTKGEQIIGINISPAVK